MNNDRPFTNTGVDYFGVFEKDISTDIKEMGIPVYLPKCASSPLKVSVQF